jgi:hypothetical protein
MSFLQCNVEKQVQHLENEHMPKLLEQLKSARAGLTILIQDDDKLLTSIARLENLNSEIIKIIFSNKPKTIKLSLKSF